MGGIKNKEINQEDGSKVVSSFYLCLSCNLQSSYIKIK